MCPAPTGYLHVACFYCAHIAVMPTNINPSMQWKSIYVWLVVTFTTQWLQWYSEQVHYCGLSLSIWIWCWPYSGWDIVYLCILWYV